MIDALAIARRMCEARDAARSIYGERWPSIRKQTRAMLEAKMPEMGATSILSCAVKLCTLDQDERAQLVYLAAACDEGSKEEA